MDIAVILVEGIAALLIVCGIQHKDFKTSKRLLILGMLLICANIILITINLWIGITS